MIKKIKSQYKKSNLKKIIFKKYIKNINVYFFQNKNFIIFFFFLNENIYLNNF
jgi:hypothetical protein